MYRQANEPSITPYSFELPVSVQLSADNRWVIMAQLIPWLEFEEEYASLFNESMGAPAKPFRMALGALIIKEKLGTSDRETVEQIKENPYLQYFLGMSNYSNEAPFEASMMVYFRERIGMDLVKKINSYLDHLSWDNFNESGDLKQQVEEYKNFTGYYPNSVHVDQIYRTRANRAWCKERGIRISGLPLGRPPKNISPETSKQALKDERIRNAIEGKFGQAKRRYGLNCILAKLNNTAETSMAITFLVINLSTLLRQVNCLFLSLFLHSSKIDLILAFLITKANIKTFVVTEKLIF